MGLLDSLFGGGGSSQNVTTTSKVSLPPWLNTALERGANMSNTLMKNRPTPEYYPGQTYAGLGDTSNEAMRRILNTARSGPPGQAEAFGQFSDTMAGDYLSGLGGTDFGSALSGLAGGNIGNLLNTGFGNALSGLAGGSGLNAIAGSTYGKNLARLGGSQADAINNSVYGQALGDSASGKYLYGGEGFNAALDAAKRQIMPQVNSQFGAAGRGGSGLAQTAQTQAMADAFARMYGDERNRQLSSASTLGGLQDSARGQQISAAGTLGALTGDARGQQLSAANALSGYYDTDKNRQLAAANALGGMYGDERDRQMAGLGLAPQMAGLAYQPGQMIGQVGGMIDANRQGRYDDNMQRYNYNANRPYQGVDDYISRINTIAGGTGGAGTTSTSQPYFNNRAGSMLGGGLLGASAFGGADFGRSLGLGGSIGSALGLGGPASAGIGALLGLLL